MLIFNSLLIFFAALLIGLFAGGFWFLVTAEAATHYLWGVGMWVAIAPAYWVAVKVITNFLEKKGI